MADMRFGRCLTPVSLPASLPVSLPASRPPSPADTNIPSVLAAVGLTAIVQPVVDDDNESDSGSSSSSSSCDEISKAKRVRLDPDYVPSTASTSPLTTAGPSQEASEQEDEAEPADSDTEDTESWMESQRDY
jgi:hypothetical protein